MGNLFSSLDPFGYTSSYITQIRVYPIKSCRGFKVSSTRLTKCGLDLDRRWMFVNAETHKFVTIRDISKLTLIDTAITEDTGENARLHVSIRGQPDKSVSIPARPSQKWLDENTHLADVEIWGQTTDAHVYSDEINKIFSDFLVNKAVKLVYKGPTKRPLRGNGSKELLGRDGDVNFPDMLPLQISNEESIRELNRRLKQKGEDEITIERFRPNVVIRGGWGVDYQAWGEDRWRVVCLVTGSSLSSLIHGSSADSLDVDVACRCLRCHVPNVDPETAVKHRKQPWNTLVEYRKIDQGLKFKPVFGMLCVPRNEGDVRVGMKFQVLETTEDHMFISSK